MHVHTLQVIDSNDLDSVDDGNETKLTTIG